MNKSKLELLRALGFDNEVENIEAGKCVFCGSTKTSAEDFRDFMSYHEFQISGICQECQDKTFIDPEE